MKNDKDSLGDRMKMYEGAECARRFLPELPIVARLDGKNFSRFTEGLERPYDVRLVRLMAETTKFLVEESNARIGYTQSDEISLVFDGARDGVFFEGKIHKMVSVLASMATGKFNVFLPSFIPEKNPPAFFDCRVWMVPSREEAVNAIIWRELDASKNSISMAARCFYSHKQLHEKNGAEMQEMMFQKGQNWNDYPSFFKRGTYVQRRKRLKILSEEELSRIPLQHRPDDPVERTEIVCLDMPPILRISNRVGVVFDGEDPLEIEDSE